LQQLEERAVPRASSLIAVGTGSGIPPLVKVYDNQGNFLDQFVPFESNFVGGVEVAVGDVNGDGTPDVVCGAGPGGGPRVRVFNGVDIMAGSANPGVLSDFFAYAPVFAGGVHVAAGDIDGDGKADVMTGA